MHSYQLPVGYVDANNVLQRAVVISSLSGKEEELLIQSDGIDRASLVTSMLKSCVKSLGEQPVITEDAVRALSVVDRQYLILKLCELTFGDRVEVSEICPHEDCHSPVDINFMLTDLPVKYDGQAGIYTIKLSQDDMRSMSMDRDDAEIVFRLPNGGDQESLARLYDKDEAEAILHLLKRCILKIGKQSSTPTLDMIGNLSEKIRLEIEDAMDNASSLVKMDMQATCPECGRKFTLPFDLQEYFFNKLGIEQDVLFREVHYLAYHYHWSEQEIMKFSRQKRHQYIGVLSEEIERMNNAVI